MTLDLRVLGLDVDDEEAGAIANEVYELLDDRGHDVEGVAPVLSDQFVLIDEAAEPVDRRRSVEPIHSKLEDARENPTERNPPEEER